MIASEYEKVICALAAAERVLVSNLGELNAADMRIRALLGIAAKEAKRALFESNHAVTHNASEAEPASVAHRAE